MRRAPAKETLRELYLKSGNQCAYPDCTDVMINSKGSFVGQVAHIEAANPGGERHNPSQSDEERRSFTNLMLLCYKHHVLTNDVTAYPLPVMQKIKADHEAMFMDVASAIGKSIIDWTENQKAIVPQTIDRLVKIMNWGFGAEEIAGTIQEISEMATALEKTPANTRKLFSIILRRMRHSNVFGDYVDPREIEEVAHIDYPELDRHTTILNHMKLTSRIISEEYDDPRISISKTSHAWAFWPDMLEFIKKTGENIDTMVIDLDFQILA